MSLRFASAAGAMAVSSRSNRCIASWGLRGAGTVFFIAIRFGI